MQESSSLKVPRGKTCQVWALYGDAPFIASDDDELFSGELGQWALNDDQLVVQLVEANVSKWLPDITINVDNGFNHLPKPGTRIMGPDGIIELGKLNV